MKCLVDANVYLDLVLARPEGAADAVRFFDAAAAARVELFLSSVTVTTVFYIIRRDASDRSLGGRIAAGRAVDRALKDLSIVAVDRPILLAARAMLGRDFEDNVQIACAVAAGVDLVVTRNVGDFAHAPLRVADPAEAARLIAAIPPA